MTRSAGACIKEPTVAAAPSASHPASDRDPGGTARGWLAVLGRVRRQVADDRLSVVAAGVAFYGLLASFPAVAALVSIYALVFDAEQVMRQLSLVTGVLPAATETAVLDRLREFTGTSRRALGLGVAGGVLLTLWSSSSAMRALIKALNGAYDTDEQRSFLHRLGLALVLTLGAIVGSFAGIAAIVVLPAIKGALGLSESLSGIVGYLRWPVIAFGFWLGLVIVYRFGPNREQASWGGGVRGAVVATALWLIGSALFSWYVGNFASYNRAYGSMGGVVILLLWFLLTSWSVLIGAEINAEFERQSRADDGDEASSGQGP